MNDRADFDKIWLFAIEDEVRLKAEASITCSEFINRLTDARKVREKPKCSDQAGIVGFGLVGTKLVLGEVVDIDEIGSGAISEPILSHGGVRQLAFARRPRCRQAFRW